MGPGSRCSSSLVFGIPLSPKAFLANGAAAIPWVGRQFLLWNACAPPPSTSSFKPAFSLFDPVL